ncbi:hypothetical protein KSP39_PZI009131 [Platanthera zijinensis]|uniref:Uncharacterized protein n=1 Tax=Platanthera zijinensis TaxID=2320716 RepID=A0AAP0BL09_9ASPA
MGKEREFSPMLGFTEPRELANRLFSISLFIEEKHLLRCGISSDSVRTAGTPPTRDRKRKATTTIRFNKVIESHMASQDEVVPSGCRGETTSIEVDVQVLGCSAPRAPPPEAPAPSMVSKIGIRIDLVILDPILRYDPTNLKTIHPRISILIILAPRMSYSLKAMNDVIEAQAHIAVTWNDHYVSLKDGYLALQEKFQTAASSLASVREDYDRDVSRFRRIGSELKAELEETRASLEVEKSLVERTMQMLMNAYEEISRLETALGVSKAQVETLSSENHVSELKAVGLAEYMDSLDYMRDRCLIGEEVREEIWSKEVEPQMEDARELALRRGVSKAFRLVARSLKCDVSSLSFDDISDDESLSPDSDADVTDV